MYKAGKNIIQHNHHTKILKKNNRHRPGILVWEQPNFQDHIHHFITEFIETEIMLLLKVPSDHICKI